MDNSLVKTAGNQLSKEDENDILGQGTVDLSSFFDNFQFLFFVLDSSQSMASGLGGGYSENRVSKMELQKRVIKKYADTKIGNKASAMKIGVVEFGSRARMVLEGSSDLEEIKTKVGYLCASGGATYIGKGIRSALSRLRRNRELTPRIIITSDGAMQDYPQAKSAAQQAKEMGVIIDTIFIGSTSYVSDSEALKELSEITGGVHEMITNEAEFDQKFLKVAERPLLSA